MKKADAMKAAQAEAARSKVPIVVVKEGPHADEFAERDADGESYGYCPEGGEAILYKYGVVVGHATPARAQALSQFEACPVGIVALIVAAECERLGMATECCMGGIFGLIRGYVTDGPGFFGDVVVIQWPASPGAITVYQRAADSKAWVFCNQTDW
jgi:hypothetical protein